MCICTYTHTVYTTTVTNYNATTAAASAVVPQLEAVRIVENTLERFYTRPSTIVFRDTHLLRASSTARVHEHTSAAR